MKPRIAFWGTPELTVEYLSALKNAEMTPVVIVTNPDRPQGRGHELTPTPAKIWAMENNIPVLQPEKINDEFLEEFKKFEVELSIVVAYGSIIPEKIINLPKYGTINVHYSLLPKYRGASPIESAILSGETETGISIQKMQFKLDTGPIIKDLVVQINPDETGPELKSRLNIIAVELLIQTLPDYIAGNLTLKIQDEQFASYAKKFKKEDGLIDLNADPKINYQKYRAYFAWPRTYFFVHDKRVIISKASFSTGQFIIEKVLPEGKKEMSYEDFKRGQK